MSCQVPHVTDRPFAPVKRASTISLLHSMRLLLLLLLPRLALAAPWPHVPPVAMASAPPGGGGDDGARPLGLLGGARGDDDPFDNSTAAPRDGRLNQSLCLG